MRSKAPLVIIEQLVMLLVFALSAAICVQIFALSERLSVQYEAEDRAVVEAECIAEEIKISGLSENETFYFDHDWNAVSEGDGEVYRVEVVLSESGSRFLGEGTITVYDQRGQQLCELPVAWQEDV